MGESCLQRRLSFDDAVEHLSKASRFGSSSEMLDEFQTWFDERFKPGDELWWYDWGGWEEMAGEAGFAIVRGGEIAYMLPQMRN